MQLPTLFLFPDTNLFVQCRALHELDWQRYGFEDIHLIVCRPIQAEIDQQKNKGSDRLSRRARAASSLFREIIIGDIGHKVVRDSNPSVKLFIELQLRPAEGVNIDYTRADDQLVAIAAKYQRQHPEADVRVLPLSWPSGRSWRPCARKRRSCACNSCQAGH